MINVARIQSLSELNTSFLVKENADKESKAMWEKKSNWNKELRKKKTKNLKI